MLIALRGCVTDFGARRADGQEFYISVLVISLSQRVTKGSNRGVGNGHLLPLFWVSATVMLSL